MTAERGVLFLVVVISFLVVGLHRDALGVAVEGQEKIRIEPSNYTSSRVCRRCHRDIYEAWKDSMHANSLRDPIFQASYQEAYFETRGDAKTLCLKCHAPTTRFNKDFDLTEDITREGVTCDFCHTISGVNLNNGKEVYQIDPGMIKFGPMVKADSPAHLIKNSEVHSQSDICAGCHEYTAPNGLVIMGTYSEWKNGPYAEKGIHCQSCHMPVVKGKVVRPEIKESMNTINLHLAPGGHSVAQIKRAVKLKIASLQKEDNHLRVDIHLTNSGSGHNMPTGTPCRQLILEVSLFGTRDRLIDKQRMVFEKDLRDAQGLKPTKVKDYFLKELTLYKDNRLAPLETREVTFFFNIRSESEYRVEATLNYYSAPEVLQPQELNVEMAQDHALWR